MNPYITDSALNWINGEALEAAGGQFFDSFNPATGEVLCRVARSQKEDVDRAVNAAKKAFPAWSGTTPVERGDILHTIATAIESHTAELAELNHLETGKSKKEAAGETGGAAAQGFFQAGEGRRLYGRTNTSGMAERTAMSFRRPVGVAGLVIAANTPIANVAWKVFPALICGNTAVLKPSEDAPLIANAFARIAKEAGLPDGVLNVVHGFGAEAGVPLVHNRSVDLISFTGSTEVGRRIAQDGGKRLAKVFLELGGKNPLVVCDDADLENACKWILLSAFSNAGQRCAAASRIIVFDSVYDALKEKVLEATAKLKIGSGDDDDFGPVINQRQLDNMLAAVNKATEEGATLLCGGGRQGESGYFMQPTLLEGAHPDSDIARKELFGPIACFFMVKNLDEAITLSNRSDYGLTACIHTSSVHRAMAYSLAVEAGSANVNVGTYGSEPHFGFGGVKDSGNGLREPGSEALDVYSEWKNININILPDAL